MISVRCVASELAKVRGSCRLAAANMCKELKTKMLRLMPPSSNGPTINEEDHDRTGTDGFESQELFSEIVL